MKTDPTPIINLLLHTGQLVRDHARRSLFEQSAEERSAVSSETAGDTIYNIDKDVEDLLVDAIEKEAERIGGVVLIAEGLPDERPVILPRGHTHGSPAWRIIVDPIDGTREIMYDKRSAFYLAAAAINKGDETRLQDIEIAAMVEIPTTRSHLSDLLWAVKGRGASRKTENLNDGTIIRTEIQPSRAETIYGGFAQLSRFFPPGRDVMALIEEGLVEALFPDAPDGRAILFEDQYISTGGQLWEMLLGHDRFIGDIRASLYRRQAAKGRKTGMSAHPYDLCAHLIGTEAGMVITDIEGNPLDGPLDTTTDVDWLAYANPMIRDEVEPVLKQLLETYGLISR